MYLMKNGSDLLDKEALGGSGVHKIPQVDVQHLKLETHVRSVHKDALALDQVDFVRVKIH